jgi:hypothetical protein
MNRAAGQRRTNRRDGTSFLGSGFGGGNGQLRPCRLRTFRLGARGGLGRRGALNHGRAGGQSLGGLRRRVLLARFRYVGFVGYIIGNVVPVQAAKPYGGVLVDGAGVRLLFGDAYFGEPFEDFVRLYFQLPRQLVNANLLHR